MTREFRFQDPGEGIREGEIVEVLVSVGDKVNEGDNVLVVETDKATTELPSPYTGTVEMIRVDPGDVISVGDPMIEFAVAEEEEAGAEAKEKAKAEGEEPGERKERRRGGGRAAAVGELPEAEPEPSRRQAAREEGAPQGPIPASPATRRLARELEVDLSEVEPSGPHRRVTRSDVQAAAEAKEKRPRVERPAREPAAPELPDFERWGSVERTPLRGVRRMTARQLTTAWQQIPHVTHHDRIDVTELERWRRQQMAKNEQEGGSKISLMALVMKGVAATLKRHPRFNASLDPEQEEIILKHYYHLGLAIDTDDGLIVGIVRDVDCQSIAELATATEEVVERVRHREVAGEELKGATFTITNVGPLGGTSFTPLINYPEVAILGMARARLEHMVTGDLDDPQTDVRLLLPLSLSFDHRVNDGADAARFLNELGDVLADPNALLLNV